MRYGKTKGLKLTSKFKTCEDYILGKAKKAGVRKITVAHSKFKGERLYIDICLPSRASLGGKKYCLLIVHESTNHGVIFERKV